MKLNERSIFLLDGVGALASAILTGIILPVFSHWIGLPLKIIYCLALFPLAYGIFSLSCFWFVKTIKTWMLKTIIIANLFYCLVSSLVIFEFPSLTSLGSLLLIAEIIIIFGVVALETKVYRKYFSS